MVDGLASESGQAEKNKRIDLKEFYLCNFYYFQGPVMRKFTGVLSTVSKKGLL